MGLDARAHLLLDRALAPLRPGERVRAPSGPTRTWRCTWAPGPGAVAIERKAMSSSGAMPVTAGWPGRAAAGSPGSVVARPPATWGLAVRGAFAEAGGPSLVGADLDDREAVWTHLAAKLYAEAAVARRDLQPADRLDASLSFPTMSRLPWYRS